MDKRPVVVIGSGFGGLAAAVRLRARGYPVLVLEARDQPGGRAGVFRRDGYCFDAGPTVITAPHLFDELFALLGRDREDYFELMDVDPFYRIELADGSRFDYVGDTERLLSQIREFHPPDVDNYLALADHSRRIFEVGYERLVDQPFDHPATMLRVVPDMVRLSSYRSVYGLVASYLEDPRLRQVFSFQPLLVGGNPFSVTSIYLLIHWLERKWGVHFARGGTTAIVEGLVALLHDVGVEVRLESPVDTIEIAHGRASAVRLADGTRIPCRFVVSNADPSFVYSRMIDAVYRRRNTDARIARMHQSMGLFVGYFGTDRTYPEIEHHSIVMGTRYRGLLDDIFRRKVLADDFSLYLHRPTASDPALAPPGHDAFYVLSPVPNTRSDVEWDTVGPVYFERLLDHLEARMLPKLREHLTTRFFVTPRYFETELRSIDGAGFGPEPRLTQSAWFRYHNVSEDVGGLYFVGAGTHPGAGVPGVINSARVVERLVEAREEAPRLRIVRPEEAAAQ